MVSFLWLFLNTISNQYLSIICIDLDNLKTICGFLLLRKLKKIHTTEVVSVKITLSYISIYLCSRCTQFHHYWGFRWHLSISLYRRILGQYVDRVYVCILPIFIHHPRTNYCFIRHCIPFTVEIPSLNNSRINKKVGREQRKTASKDWNK